MKLPSIDRLIVALVTATLTWCTAYTCVAAPSQTPMLGASPAAPDVVFTLDDSGSMLYAIMPDDYTSDYVQRPNTQANVLNPHTASGNCCSVQTLVIEDTISTYDQYGYGYGVIPTRVPPSSCSSDSGFYCDDAYRRSSTFNSIYYDPNTVYTPWVDASGNTMTVPTANNTSNWTKVTLDPIKGGTANLTPRSLVGTSQRFCLTYGTCDPRSLQVTNSYNNSSAYRPAYDAWNSYDPTVYYTYNSASNSFTRVSIWNGTNFTRNAARTDCSVSGNTATCTRDQELSNFATWFTYYRTRLLLAKGSVGKAFASGNVTGFRLGWGALNDPGVSSSGIDSGAPYATMIQGVRDFSSSQKSSFYNWLYNKTAQNGTPLRRAISDVGKYFQREDKNSPWADNPGSGTSQAASSFAGCRRAFHIMTTDGYWSAGTSYDAGKDLNNVQVSGVDWESTNGPNITSPSGTTYQYKASDSANSKYKDGTADMLADTAMYYWNRDLAPNVPNLVPSSDQNESFWQSLVNYTVGMGVSGNLNNPNDKTAIENGSKSWRSDNITPISDRQKGDDLWHAAYNSRGLNLNAGNVDEFSSALVNILANITKQSYATAGVAVSGTTLTSDTSKYVPGYTPGTWVGTLQKIGRNSSTGNWNTSPIWEASTVLPPQANRNIYVWKGGNVAPKAVPFSYTNLDSTMISEMGNSPTVNATLINYLRGDNTTNVGTNAGNYRARASLLGDIVNSPPLYVKDTLDYQYDLVPYTAAASSYRAFVKNSKNKSGMIYVGANDGMLHAFDDATGVEKFAFVPRAVLGNLGKLSNQSYAHQFYVDGPLMEAHAYFGGGWHSVVLGSLGAGGTGLFAIDATSPATLSSSSAGTQVLWELNASNAGTSADANAIGNIFGDVDVGPIKIGSEYKWVALVGNGPYSSSGTAQLLVIDISNGTILARLDTAAGSANGLGGVRAARDVSGVIVAAYAGDVKGNVWRFDLNGAQNQWAVGYGGTPLFRAGNSQPITAAPSVLPHPRGGTMVVVGTGKLIESTDRSDTSTQALYGLWDKVEPTNTTAGNSSVISADKSTLIQQTISASPVGTANGRTYYESSNNRPDWSTKRGWYMNLTLPSTNSGQRVIYPAQLFRGFVLVGTVVPGGGGICGSSSAYNALLDALNGTVNATQLFDVNGDGQVNTSDRVASWYATDSDGRDRIVQIPRQKDPSDTSTDPTKNMCPPGATRIVSGTSSLTQCGPRNDLAGARTWRMLINPPR